MHGPKKTQNIYPQLDDKRCKSGIRPGDDDEEGGHDDDDNEEEDAEDLSHLGLG